NRAMGVYAAMSVAGGAVGLIAGGLLTTYASWRWVLFVNVPIGLVAALAAPRVLSESGRQRGRFDLPGAIPGTGGTAALGYGLSNAAASADGVSHWGDAKVVASLAASVVLLAAFAVIETRSKRPLLPVRLLADRNRTGANLIMLCIGTAVFGMFFFLTVFLQSAWGYSALKTGVAYLPLMAGILVFSGAAAQLVPRTGARPLLLTGAPATAGGLYWLSRLTEHGSYAAGVLGPMLVIAAGLGLLFMPVTLVAMAHVADGESGVAASLRNTGQQVGGAIGLALLGTVAWTVAANTIQAQAAAAHTGHPAQPGRAALAATYHHALAAGFSRAYLVAAAIMLPALVITIVAIRVKGADLGEARLCPGGRSRHGRAPHPRAPRPGRLDADDRDPPRAAPRPGPADHHHGRPRGRAGPLDRVPRPATPSPRRRARGDVAAGPGQAHRRPARPGPAGGDGRRAAPDRPLAGDGRRRVHHGRTPGTAEP